MTSGLHRLRLAVEPRLPGLVAGAIGLRRSLRRWRGDLEHGWAVAEVAVRLRRFERDHGRVDEGEAMSAEARALRAEARGLRRAHRRVAEALTRTRE